MESNESSLHEPPTPTSSHPAEDESPRSPEPGLDVTGDTAFDEVDVIGLPDNDEVRKENDNDAIPETKEELVSGVDSSSITPDTTLAQTSEDVVDGESPPSETKPLGGQDSSKDDEIGKRDDATDDDEDDDNMSFTSATSEPVPEDVTESTPPVVTETTKDELAENEESKNVVEKETTPPEEDIEDRRTTLEKIGIDKSIFGVDEDTSDDFNESPLETNKANSKEEEEDESALFFGSAAQNNHDNNVAEEEPKDSGNQSKEPAPKKMGLFEDSEEDDLFNTKV